MRVVQIDVGLPIGLKVAIIQLNACKDEETSACGILLLHGGQFGARGKANGFSRRAEKSSGRQAKEY